MTNNPYINARREWSERYGSYVQRARQMTFIAIITSLIALTAVAGLVYIGSQSRLVPYVVETHNGKPVDILTPYKSSENQLVTKAVLARWITAVRSVTSDTVVQNSYLKTSYSLIQNGSPAKKFLDQHYRSGFNPFSRSKNKQVSIKVSSILALSAHTWQIEWQETERNISGDITSVFDMRAAINTSFIAVDEQTVEVNPIGLITNSINWSKVNRRES